MPAGRAERIAVHDGGQRTDEEGKHKGAQSGGMTFVGPLPADERSHQQRDENPQQDGSDGQVRRPFPEQPGDGICHDYFQVHIRFLLQECG